MTRTAERSDDVRTLVMLDLRVRGFGWDLIAHVFGLTPKSISATCRAVRDADAAESGEAIAQAYP
ncbi:hypothetical protein ACR03S_10235 [Limimaricola variabilis]